MPKCTKTLGIMVAYYMLGHARFFIINRSLVVSGGSFVAQQASQSICGKLFLELWLGSWKRSEQWCLSFPICPAKELSSFAIGYYLLFQLITVIQQVWAESQAR